MAYTHKITCINKSDRQNPHERITSVGGTNPDGTRWKLFQREARTGMDEGRWKFYISVNGKTAWVTVTISQYGHKFLKTENDGEQINNLPILPECS